MTTSGLTLIHADLGIYRSEQNPSLLITDHVNLNIFLFISDLITIAFLLFSIMLLLHQVCGIQEMRFFAKNRNL